VSLTPALYNLSLYEKCDWTQAYQLPVSLGVDFTGYSVVAEVKVNYDDEVAILSLGADVALDGTFTLTAAAADIPAADTYRWAASLTNGTLTYPLWFGDVTVVEWTTP